MAKPTSKAIRFHEFGPAEVLKVEKEDIRVVGQFAVRAQSKNKPTFRE